MTNPTPSEWLRKHAEDLISMGYEWESPTVQNALDCAALLENCEGRINTVVQVLKDVCREKPFKLDGKRKVWLPFSRDKLNARIGRAHDLLQEIERGE